LAAATGAYAVVHRFGRTWGATAEERRAELPGDGLVPRPLLATTHSVTVAGSPSAVWSALVESVGPRFVIADTEPERALVVVSVAPKPRWTRVDVSRAFVLSERSESTRLVVRTRAWLAPWWLAAGYWLAIVPVDFVMTRQMFRGLQARVGR
jgi:hypothetical protein